jgi:hypothetical protein
MDVRFSKCPPMGRPGHVPRLARQTPRFRSSKGLGNPTGRRSRG